MVIDSIKITCMSHFWNSIFDFESMLKSLTLTNMLLQILFINIYIRWFNFENDYGQSCHVQQISMQYAYLRSSILLFTIWLQVSFLLRTIASNAIF